MMDMEYYDKIVTITGDYLGPAAGRFVDRQIDTHLNKAPQDLQRSDITMLAIRIRSGLLILTQDEEVGEEAYRRITAVADI